MRHRGREIVRHDVVDKIRGLTRLLVTAP